MCFGQAMTAQRARRALKRSVRGSMRTMRTSFFPFSTRTAITLVRIRSRPTISVRRSASQRDVLAPLAQAVERQEGVGRDLGRRAPDIAGAPVLHVGEGARPPAFALRVFEHGDPVERQDVRIAAA